VIEGGTSNRASPASGQTNPLWALTSRPAFPKITFDKAVVSYNGDFVLHFNHPTWREDENGPL
jgi:hypothetical protein